MTSDLKVLKFSTMRVHPEAIVELKAGEELFRKKRGTKPAHSEAIKMATAAWIRELKAA